MDFNPQIVVKSLSVVSVALLTGTLLMKPGVGEEMCRGFALLCIVMSVNGIVRYFLREVAHGRCFVISFPFDNPCGFGIFLAILFPYLWQCCRRLPKLLAFLCMALPIVALFLSESRTCILAVAVAMVTMADIKWSKWNVVLLGAIVVICIVVMYCLKPISADGRFFISCISMDLLSENWLFGGGGYAFDTEYMLRQAKYFASHPFSKWVMVAGNVRSPFNEYMLLLVRFGLVGIVIFGLMVLYVVKMCRKSWTEEKRIPLSSVYALAMASVFSYPLSYHLIVLLFTMSVTMLLKPNAEIKSGYFTKYHRLMFPICGLLLLIVSLLFCRQEMHRLSLETMVENGNTGPNVMKEYKEMSEFNMYKRLPQFLWNYAECLYEQKKWQEALSVLARYEKYRIDYDTQMLHSYLLLQIGKERRAVSYFRVASDMVPCMMQPRYEVVRLLKTMDREEDAVKEAEKAIGIPLKVPNSTSLYYRNAMMETIEEVNNNRHSCKYPWLIFVV
ncbi:MAG: O-antigen ligase family protein [Muribaculaceae bacterium]